MREKRREGFGFSPEFPLLLLFFLEKPKEVRRLDSMLGLGPVVVPVTALMLSLDIGAAMDVGG
jgi:hypothetical protein